MKRIIALMLALVLCLTLAACGGGETATKDDELLPFGLRFGMTYDEAQNKHENLSALNEATSNDGYLSEVMEFEYEELAEYFSTAFNADQELYGKSEDLIFNDYLYAFSFNENKELYEMYITASFTSVSHSVSDGENFFNYFCDFFDERLGTEAEINETDSRLTANYETETLGVSVMLKVKTDVIGTNFCDATIVVHDKTHELSE